METKASIALGTVTGYVAYQNFNDVLIAGCVAVFTGFMAYVGSQAAKYLHNKMKK